MCNREAASVEAAHKQYGDQVALVGVAWNGTEDEMQGFVDKYAITFQNLNDQTGELFAHFGVPSQPAWVFVNAAGEVDGFLGALEPEVMASAFERVLGA